MTQELSAEQIQQVLQGRLASVILQRDAIRKDLEGQGAALAAAAFALVWCCQLVLLPGARWRPVPARVSRAGVMSVTC
jgi:hypothetical protein